MFLANYYFFKFSEKRKTRRKRKHKGTLLSQRTNKEGTQFLDQQGRNTVKTETVTKGSNSKHIPFFVKKGE